MMDQYTKLADELDAVNDVCGSRSIREAARILRAAAGVDVAGLMDVADRYALAQADPAHWRSALESDLRLALAAREGFVLVPVEPTPEMLHAALKDADDNHGYYATRGYVDEDIYLSGYRAMIAAAPKGTP